MNIPEKFNKIDRTNGFDLVTNDRNNQVHFREMNLIQRLRSLKLNHSYLVKSINNGKIQYKGYFITKRKAQEKALDLAFRRNEEIFWETVE